MARKRAPIDKLLHNGLSIPAKRLEAVGNFSPWQEQGIGSGS